MSETDTVFSGSVPELYDSYLVPLIFESYAADLARRTVETAPQAVLETAAGSGVVARALAPLLASDARYVVSDLNQPMLDRAEARQTSDNRISWRQVDALSLPFADGSFDAVCCQFGVMFFPDKVAGYREALRVLRPGGRFLFSSWDRIEENVFAKIATDCATEIFPYDPPRFLARTPHGYNDVERIRADVEVAGFKDVEIVSIAGESVAPTPRHPAIAYCQGTPLRGEIETRDGSQLGPLTDRVEAAIAKDFGKDRVSAKIQAHVVTATAPK